MKSALSAVAALAVGILSAAHSAHAEVYTLTVDALRGAPAGITQRRIGFNGGSPGPTLRFKEGETVTIHVTNNLSVDTSVHWHGLILPTSQDGVPTLSYDGIQPGETFTYQFPIQQAGTYWYHSHSGFQEPDGAYGAIIIEPKEPEPYRYDRDYVVQLTDAHRHSGARIMRNLRNMPDYYNRQQRTAGDLLRDFSRLGVGATLADRRSWGGMRMMPTDIEDVQGFTPLINGASPEQNWTGLFMPGERVRLRLINSSAMTYFDIRIPGLEMTVVQADGNDVQPVRVSELRIGVAETYDVIVHPTENRAYTIFGESMGRSAYARGTLAPRQGMTAPVPPMRDPPLLTHADMALSPAMAGMDHGAMGHGSGEMDHAAMGHGSGEMDHAAMGHGSGGMDHAAMGHGSGGMDHAAMGHGSGGMDHAAMGHGSGGMDHALPPGAHRMPDGTIMGGPSHDPFYAAGSGLIPEAAEPGGRFLSYTDLKAFRPLYPDREPTREIVLRLTGNMERYMWSINDIPYAEADPIVLQYGERVRFRFINETMMTHPMHLHGMWSILEIGAGAYNPAKHVVSVSPGTEVLMETEVDAPGQWAFHCHLSYHAASGMFRKVIVVGGPDEAAAAPAHEDHGHHDHHAHHGDER